MPPKAKPPAADLADALTKKGGLTLTQLADYDDLVTDALVDRVHYWSKIRKLRSSYHPSRRIKEPEVCEILRSTVIVERNAPQAAAQLLGLPGIKQYYDSRGTADEREHFARHLRKYVDIYLPDCPFEVGTVNRYTITTQEASIIARKTIKEGEAIKYLTGIQVGMTKDEEKILGENDFSVIRSSRRKQSSLFLGPARFANHDCDANADLQTTGKHGMFIKAVKDISVGEEITVLYGLDYFGSDNCECLCGTCENLRRNGWDPRGPVIFPDSDEEDDDDEEVEEVQSKGKKGTPKARKEALKREREEPQATRSAPPGKRRKTDSLLPMQVTKDLPTAKSADSTPTQNAMPVKRGRGRPPKIRPAVEAVAQATVETATPDPALFRVNDRMKQEPKEDETPMSAIPEAQPAKTYPELQSISLAESLTALSRRSGSKQSLPTPPGSDSRRNSKRIRGEEVAAELSRPDKKSKLQHISKTAKQSPLRRVTNIQDEATVYDNIETPEPEPVKKIRPRAPASFNHTRRSREDSDSATPPSTRSTASRHSDDASSATTLEDRPNIAEGIVAQLTGSIGESNQHFDPREMRRRRNAISSARPTASPSPEAEANETEDDEKETSGDDIFEFNSSNEVVSHRRRTTDSKPATSTSAAEELPAPKKRHLTRSRSTRDSLQPFSGPSTPRATIEPTGTPNAADEAAAEAAEGITRGAPRVPGDYHTFLPTLYHAYTECQNCEQLFLQGEKFQTRILCPGCERHGRLYGFEWPRTVAKWEGEKRCTDPRGWRTSFRTAEVRELKGVGGVKEESVGVEEAKGSGKPKERRKVKPKGNPKVVAQGKGWVIERVTLAELNRAKNKSEDVSGRGARAQKRAKSLGGR